MDFLVSWNGCGIRRMVSIDKALTDVEDETEAISKAREFALRANEGMVALFTRDGEPICGWEVMEGGKLRDEPISAIQYRFNVSPETFELAKRQKDERKRQKDERKRQQDERKRQQDEMP